MHRLSRLAFSLLAAALLAGCVQPAPGAQPWTDYSSTSTPPAIESATQEQIKTKPAAWLPTSRPPGAPYHTPTPNAPRVMPTLRSDMIYHSVQWGESLGYIASLYNLDLGMLLAANTLVNPDVLEVGQIIAIPAPQPGAEISDFKIIPDSELVYGPVSATLDIDNFVRENNGYLEIYSEPVDDVETSGIDIVKRISADYSVNPRLLLALLEYRSRWVTSRDIDEFTRTYPMGYNNPERDGLFYQLSWAASLLNRGYYLWKAEAISYVGFTNGTLGMLSPRINAGTAAVQYMLGVNSVPAEWEKAISEDGLYRTYTQFFGIPFDLTVEPLLPADLAQPELILPFEPGIYWSLTGGPHASWGDGSAWGALDFAPPGEESGCFKSDEWVTAVADGVITRSANGAVVLDLDGDGLEQTGWTILYMHIGALDRIKAGSKVKTGNRIGHPSCEGGVSDGTHVHVARRYNGEWISADTDLPFNLSGWISHGNGEEYSGTLTKDGKTVYSWNGRTYDNQIRR